MPPFWIVQICSLYLEKYSEVRGEGYCLQNRIFPALSLQGAFLRANLDGVTFCHIYTLMTNPHLGICEYE